MYLKSLFVLFISIFLISCGSETKELSKDENKGETNTTKQVSENETKEKESSNSDFKLAKIEKVETVSEKNVVPNFTWVSAAGGTGSFEEVKDNVVFLNLWATWCGPCIKEMPDLSAISTELSDKKFMMIGLNVFHQPGTKDVETFLKELPVSYLVVDGNEEIVQALSKSTGTEIDAVPTSYIVKDGKIVETIVGSRSKAEFLKMINKYL